MLLGCENSTVVAILIVNSSRLSFDVCVCVYLFSVSPPLSRVFPLLTHVVPQNIYIYQYPSLQLMRVLRGGAERSFSCLAFSGDGLRLASVAGFPDYLLHVWNWDKEAVMLRTKAFAQEVFRVTFHPQLDGVLTTSGTGHIRFWKMARTFTGLKLQGEIGKFGNVELSDIAGYAELPDGKVLSVSFLHCRLGA